MDRFAGGGRATAGSLRARVLRLGFDLLRQLGIAHDPLTLRGRVATVLNHPITIGRALVRKARAR